MKKRRSGKKYRFVNRKGESVVLDGNLTLSELWALGVRHIELCEPTAPLKSDNIFCWPR